MGKISALTEAVREALVALRDPDASASDVRAKIVELHPEMAGETEGSLSARVYQQRDWAREQIGGQRRRAARTKRRPAGPATLERYQMAERFLALCGGKASYAEEVLSFLEKIDPAELRQAYEAWQQLVAAAGNAQKARQVLATMRDTGMV
jgi:predicted DNA-binding transcriptional regulator YafY